MKTQWMPVLVLFLLVWLCPPCALAARQPHPLLTDNRIRQVAYDPNQVVEIVGAYGYVTTIEFAADEVVKGKTFGDSIAWQTLVRDNHLYLKPVEPEAAGNMTVVTNKRSYFFKLTSSNDDVVFLVRFTYPAWPAEGDVFGTSAPQREEAGRGINPAQLNLNYAAAGHKDAIRLTRVFDDGEFTYFQFAPHADIPSFYFVESNGTESSVNIRREGDYMVVERVGRLFVLRNGDAHLCVENTAME